MKQTLPKVIINGDFYCNNLTGIERYANEITKRLDALSAPYEIGIIIPRNGKNIPLFTNLKTIRYDKDIVSFPKWQQCILPRILKQHKAIPLDFGNACSLFRPGISFLHDIYAELYPQDFTTKREIFERFYFRLMYRIIAKRARRICTVSQFSKDQIIQRLGVKSEKITVIYSSHLHFKTIQADYSVFDEHRELSQPYYFS
ncbi:MAG: glycosyltransferase, partial [Spirochaetaceae bacterium]|nr:glycosyltransferase [Spirochaetaceae bacterium]